MSSDQQHRQPSPFTACATAHEQKCHLLLAATGSVATIKIPQIIAALDTWSADLDVILLLSTSATKFLSGQSTEQPRWATLRRFGVVRHIFTDADEWGEPREHDATLDDHDHDHRFKRNRRDWTRGDPILHIELRRWADVMLVAPLSANSMSDVVHGCARGLVTSVMRAWDTDGSVDGPRPGFQARNAGVEKRDSNKPTRFSTPQPQPPPPTRTSPPGQSRQQDDRRATKIIVLAPAMNTAMWLHPVTGSQMRVLDQQWGVGHGGWIEVLRPIEKVLACGDVGVGAMRDWSEIVEIIVARLGLSR